MAGETAEKYRKLGLVLSGGGARGAYQIGVWKAMREVGLDRHVRAIAGTSIGAINAALFLQGDFHLAEQAWFSVQSHQVLSWDPKHTMKLLLQWVAFGARGWLEELSQIGLFTRSGVNTLIDKFIDLEVVSQSRIPAWVTCRRINPNFAATYPWDWAASGPVEYFRLNYESPQRIRSYLLASSAIPLIFGAQVIDGFGYADAGIGHPAEHSPIKPVYEYGCDVIIVVHTEQTQTVNAADFPSARIVQISPHQFLGGSRATFDFTPEGVRRRIALGYADAKDVVSSLAPLIEGDASNNANPAAPGAKQGALQKLRALFRRPRARAKTRHAPKALRSKRARP